jgi:putative permease
MRANLTVLKRERRLKLAAFLSVLFFILIFLLALKNISISFLIAILIVYMLNPVVVYLQRLGLSKAASITIVFGAITILFVVAGYLLAPLVSDQFSEIQRELPRYKEGLQTIANKVETSFNDTLGSFYQVRVYDTAVPYLQKYLINSLETLPQRATDLVTILILAPFFAFFILRDGKQISRGLLSLVPNNLFEVTLSLSHKINEQIGGFIRARLVEALIVGLVVLVGLEILSFPYAVVLSIFAALTNLIPYIGPIIGALPALLVAVIDKDGSATVLFVTTVYLIAQVIDMAVIIPLVVAKIVNLHPVLVVLAIMVGAEVGGILGMIISIPVTSAFKLIFATIYTQLITQNSDA